MSQSLIGLHPSHRQNGKSRKQRNSRNIHHPGRGTVLDRSHQSIRDVGDKPTLRVDAVEQGILEEGEERGSKKDKE